MGYVRRQRDPQDERQVLVALTDAGRRVREEALHISLMGATGLSGEEFRSLQKEVVRMRDNLIRNTAD
jgi:DNA-binding MarR family transcriptional regulator